MFDCVTSAGPAITPATAASPVPTPNTSMNTRGTLWPSIATMCGMGERGLDDEPDRGCA